MAFVIIGAAILAIWGWQYMRSQTSEPKEIVLKTAEVKEVKIDDESPQYKIVASYPEFINSGGPAREEAANALINEKVQKSIGAFRDASKEAAGTLPEAKSEMQISYKVVNLNLWVASIEFSEYTYIEGAAHPLGLFWSFNYNFKDNREIALADLFNPGSNYLSVLSDLSRKSLKNQLKEYYFQESIEFGTAPESENFSVFFLGKDKLIIIFNVYQVTGYAAGPQTVEISYDELRAVINPEGAIQLTGQ